MTVCVSDHIAFVSPVRSTVTAVSADALGVGAHCLGFILVGVALDYAPNWFGWKWVAWR